MWLLIADTCKHAIWQAAALQLGQQASAELQCVLMQASVAGALSRDVMFARVAPSTYALKANIALRK